MSADSYNAWSLLLQVVIGAAVVGTFIVYYFQLRAMRAASLAQNLLAIHTFIFEESFRRDRGTLITLGEQRKHLVDWSPEDRRAAERVCAAYNLVGLTVSYGLVPFKLMDDVRYSMTKCHAAAEELLRETRAKRSPEMWHHFTDMVNGFGQTT